MDIAFCLLSGGKSSRFGKDKSSELLNGKRLIDFPLELLSYYTDKIYVSCVYDSSLDRIKDNELLNIVKIRDKNPYLGPLCGIYQVISEINADYYLFLGVDMPFITKNMINQLIDYTKGYVHAAVFECNKQMSPLPLFLSKDSRLFFEQYSCNNRSIKNILYYRAIRIIHLNDCNSLLNINTQDDFNKAKLIMARYLNS